MWEWMREKRKKKEKKAKKWWMGERGERVVDDLPMSRYYAPPPTPFSQPWPLYKQRSWFPNVEQDEAWLKRNENYEVALRRRQNFTNYDLEEFKVYIKLGFIKLLLNIGQITS